MTKKELKEMSSFHTYTGRGIKINAIFFDWKQGTGPDDKFFCGYKYMVKANVREATKAELLNVLHGWVNGSLSTPPYYVDYKFAETDTQRFKVPISM
jgi:hypothetical protein